MPVQPFFGTSQANLSTGLHERLYGQLKKFEPGIDIM